MANPLASTDPSDIANAARCFSSCVPQGEQGALKTYLLNQITQIVGPPCTTPSAPFRIRLGNAPIGQPNPGSTTIAIVWSERNSGSFVTGYQVFWGTTMGGPYPNSSPVIATNHYQITGLNSGTQYFIVVQAIAFAGCVSANSAEFTATTTGNTPNGLLNGLVHFYQFQEATAMFADSGSDPISLSFTNAGAGFVRTTGHVQAFAGSYQGVPASANKVGTIAAAPFDFTGDGTGNISMTWALWVQMIGASGAQPATSTLMSVHTPVYFFAWLNSNNFEFSMQTAGGVQTNLTSAFAYDNNFHLLIGGFDQPNGVIFFSVDGGG